MGDNTVTIHIEECEWAPGGATISVDTWRIRNNERVYFERSKLVSGITIPADTVLVLEADGDHYKAKAVTGTWKLHFGIHRGTVMTRDSASEAGFHTLDALKANYQRRKESWSWETNCWFAYAIPPGGKLDDKVVIDQSIPYSR